MDTFDKTDIIDYLREKNAPISALKIKKHFGIKIRKLMYFLLTNDEFVRVKPFEVGSRAIHSNVWKLYV